MMSELYAATNGNKDQTIFLRADKKVSYDDIANLLSSLRAAGYLQVSRQDRPPRAIAVSPYESFFSPERALHAGAWHRAIPMIAP